MSYFAHVSSKTHAMMLAALLSVTAFGLAGGANPAVAAEPASGTDASSDIVKTLEPVLQKARETGATIVVVDPNASNKKAETKAKNTKPGIVENLKRARRELARIVGTTGGLIPSMRRTLASASPDGSMAWLGWAVVIAVIAIAIAEFLRRWLRDWGRRQFLNLYDPNPRNRSTKIGYLLSRALLMLIGVALFVVVAGLIASFAAGSDAPTRLTAQIVVLATTGFLFARVVLLSVLAPDVASHRMVNLSDDDAAGLFRAAIAVAAITATVIAVCGWMDALGLSRDAHQLALVAATFISALSVAVLAVIYREPIANAIIGTGEEPEHATFSRLLARNWHILAIVYVIAAWSVSSVRLILDFPSALGMVMAPVNI